MNAITPNTPYIDSLLADNTSLRAINVALSAEIDRLRAALATASDKLKDIDQLKTRKSQHPPLWGDA